MFAATLLMTLLVEFVVVRRFKYPLSNRTNVLTVLLTNIVTQMFLYISIEFLGLHFLIAEAIILVVEAVVFAVLIVVLLVKPTGLLGKPVREKV